MAPGSAGTAADERQKRRWANRRVVWAISTVGRFRMCGRAVLDHTVGVTVKRGPNGGYVVGVARCASIWSCACCGAKIRGERANDIGKVTAEHVRAGGTAYMVTLTARHHRRHELAALMDASKVAFTRLITGAQWAGDKARGRIGERERMGIVGVIRSVEVTYGQTNGWHPHLHLVVLMGGRQNPRPAIPRKADRPEGWVKPEWDPRPTGYFPVPDPEAQLIGEGEELEQMRAAQAGLERMQERWSRVWTAWLREHGFAPNAEHGVKWDRIDTIASGERIGEYLAKTQDGRSVGAELARGDGKAARKAGNVTPFQLLDRYREVRDMPVDEAAEAGIDVDAELARVRGVWVEYETTTKGRRAIEWSRGLRAAYGLDEEEPTDEAVVSTDEGGESVALLDTPTWRRVCRLGLDYAVTRAAEESFGALVQLLAVVHLEPREPDPEAPTQTAQSVNLARAMGPVRAHVWTDEQRQQQRQQGVTTTLGG